MKKDTNLIVRVDNNLNSAIEQAAIDWGKSKSEIVRSVLSLIFLENYKNDCIRDEVLESIDKGKNNFHGLKDNLNRMTNIPIDMQKDINSYLDKRIEELEILRRGLKDDIQLFYLHLKNGEIPLE